MPRRIPKEIEEPEEVVEDEIEDYENPEQEFEEEIVEAPVRKKPVKKQARPLTRRPIQRQQPKQPVQRYGVVAPTPIRIADAETGEVVGEGEYAVYQTLADIVERLERIETAIGSMIE
jgi:hypothetical protein